MLKFQGKPVGSNYGCGKILCLKRKSSQHMQAISSHETTREHLRLDSVIKDLISDIDETLEALDLDKEQIDILNTHKMILQDPEMLANVREVISEELITLENALQKNLSSIKDLFSSMKDDYLAARYLDYKDVTQRLMNKLSNTQEDRSFWKGKVIVSTEITPSEVLEAYRNKSAGVISLTGSTKSHTAILAKSLMVPFITDIHGNTDCLCNSDYVILDCVKGIVISNPDEQTIKIYQQRIGDLKEYLHEMEELTGKEAITAGGKRIKLLCNIEIPEEVEIIKKLNSDGVGLFRTEFIYLDRDNPPSEEEQFKIYKSVAEKLSPLPLVIRTMDIGGDKSVSYLQQLEDNPNLGLRGIRMSFSMLDIFRNQIRAILRAAAFGNIKVMFPMISSVEEIIRAKELLREYAEELIAEGLTCNSDIKTGTMIEVPSAAILADDIAKACDFLSIGTNDLVQYTLAVDRNNELVSNYYNETHPAILQLIKRVCDAAHNNGIEASVCGELASQIEHTEMLLGLGVDQLSISPDQYNEVKKTIINIKSIKN